MPQTEFGIATSLAYNDGSARTITQIVSYDTNDTEELAAFLRGTARVNTHYQSTRDGYIKIVTSDLAARALATIGKKVTAVVLTIAGAVDAGGSSVGDAITVTLSHAVIASRGPLTHANSSREPGTYEIEFKMDRLASAESDPTYTIASVT